eukprot:3737070-Amphidinium_carterae.1
MVVVSKWSLPWLFLRCVTKLAMVSIACSMLKAGCMDWVMHIIALPWTVLAGAMPPVKFYNGWALFHAALLGKCVACPRHRTQEGLHETIVIQSQLPLHLPPLLLEFTASRWVAASRPNVGVCLLVHVHSLCARDWVQMHIFMCRCTSSGIALVTALISDLAHLVGCVLEMDAQACAVSPSLVLWPSIAARA